MTDAPPTVPPFGAVGRCLKCGRPIEPTETMCEVCNRAGMVAPAATQMHGTVAVAIIGSVAGMAILASILLGEPGPFATGAATVGSMTGTALEVQVPVSNHGEREGRARCQLTALDPQGLELAQTVVVTEPIDAGGTVTLDATIPDVTAQPAKVEVRCQ